MTALRILHLEDDPADAQLIAEQLLRSNLDAVITVAQGRKPFEAALASKEFDLVLSDYRVPGFNGIEALELLRAAGRKIPFILVTGALGDEGAIELLRTGATDCVLKDRMARLASAIRRALVEHEAQMRHEEVQTQLAEANQLAKLAADEARLGAWQLHVAAGKLECSDGFLSLLRVGRERWQGTLAALDACMHPEDAERRRVIFRDAMEHGRYVEMEFRTPIADGEVRWMHLRGNCSLDAGATLPVYTGVMMDITERKRMEEALRDGDRRKSEFLAMLAHELRNPLAPIYNGLSILRQDSALSSEQRHIHAMLERQANHIIRLVDDLMEVSRYTTGKLELKRGPIELHTVLHNAIEMSRPFIDAGRHKLEVVLPPGTLMLDADGVRLAQVLSNLLNNAAKYTAEGGKIRVHVGLEDARPVISVRDNGQGIPADMLNRVFDLFTQIDNRRSADGLGIGLAMVRMLVELHGGEVEARSPGPGLGSEFLVRLPVLRQGHAAINAGAGARDAPLTGCKILVVDDNIDAADTLGMLLTLAGAQVHVAYDGPSALAAVPIHRPQVVLLDIGMPGMDGCTVASKIRQDARNRDMLLIALTGFGQDEDRSRSSVAGFDEHLTKPADLNLLQKLIARNVTAKGYQEGTGTRPRFVQ